MRISPKPAAARVRPVVDPAGLVGLLGLVGLVDRAGHVRVARGLVARVVARATGPAADREVSPVVVLPPPDVQHERVSDGRPRTVSHVGLEVRRSPRTSTSPISIRR